MELFKDSPHKVECINMPPHVQFREVKLPKNQGGDGIKEVVVHLRQLITDEFKTEVGKIGDFVEKFNRSSATQFLDYDANFGYLYYALGQSVFVINNERAYDLLSGAKVQAKTLVEFHRKYNDIVSQVVVRDRFLFVTTDSMQIDCFDTDSFIASAGKVKPIYTFELPDAKKGGVFIKQVAVRSAKQPTEAPSVLVVLSDQQLWHYNGKLTKSQLKVRSAIYNQAGDTVIALIKLEDPNAPNMFFLDASDISKKLGELKFDLTEQMTENKYFRPYSITDYVDGVTFIMAAFYANEEQESDMIGSAITFIINEELNAKSSMAALKAKKNALQYFVYADLEHNCDEDEGGKTPTIRHEMITAEPRPAHTVHIVQLNHADKPYMFYRDTKTGKFTGAEYDDPRHRPAVDIPQKEDGKKYFEEEFECICKTMGHVTIQGLLSKDMNKVIEQAVMKDDVLGEDECKWWVPPFYAIYGLDGSLHVYHVFMQELRKKSCLVPLMKPQMSKIQFKLPAGKEDAKPQIQVQPQEQKQIKIESNKSEISVATEKEVPFKHVVKESSSKKVKEDSKKGGSELGSNYLTQQNVDSDGTEEIKQNERSKAKEAPLPKEVKKPGKTPSKVEKEEPVSGLGQGKQPKTDNKAPAQQKEQAPIANIVDGIASLGAAKKPAKAEERKKEDEEQQIEEAPGQQLEYMSPQDLWYHVENHPEFSFIEDQIKAKFEQEQADREREKKRKAQEIASEFLQNVGAQEEEVKEGPVINKEQIFTEYLNKVRLAKEDLVLFDAAQRMEMMDQFAMFFDQKVRFITLEWQKQQKEAARQRKKQSYQYKQEQKWKAEYEQRMQQPLDDDEDETDEEAEEEENLKIQFNSYMYQAEEQLTFSYNHLIVNKIKEFQRQVAHDLRSLPQVDEGEIEQSHLDQSPRIDDQLKKIYAVRMQVDRLISANQLMKREMKSGVQLRATDILIDMRLKNVSEENEYLLQLLDELANKKVRGANGKGIQPAFTTEELDRMKATVRKYIAFDKNMRYIVFQLKRLEQIPQVAQQLLLQNAQMDEPNVQRVVSFARDNVCQQDGKKVEQKQQPRFAFNFVSQYNHGNGEPKSAESQQKVKQMKENAKTIVDTNLDTQQKFISELCSYIAGRLENLESKAAIDRDQSQKRKTSKYGLPASLMDDDQDCTVSNEKMSMRQVQVDPKIKKQKAAAARKKFLADNTSEARQEQLKLRARQAPATIHSDERKKVEQFAAALNMENFDKFRQQRDQINKTVRAENQKIIAMQPQHDHDSDDQNGGRGPGNQGLRAARQPLRAVPDQIVERKQPPRQTLADRLNNYKPQVSSEEDESDSGDNASLQLGGRSNQSNASNDSAEIDRKQQEGAAKFLSQRSQGFGNGEPPEVARQNFEKKLERNLLNNDSSTQVNQAAPSNKKATVVSPQMLSQQNLLAKKKEEESKALFAQKLANISVKDPAPKAAMPAEQPKPAPAEPPKEESKKALPQQEKKAEAAPDPQSKPPAGMSSNFGAKPATNQQQQPAGSYSFKPAGQSSNAPAPSVQPMGNLFSGAGNGATTTSMFGANSAGGAFSFTNTNKTFGGAQPQQQTGFGGLSAAQLAQNQKSAGVSEGQKTFGSGFGAGMATSFSQASQSQAAPPPQASFAFGSAAQTMTQQQAPMQTQTMFSQQQPANSGFQFQQPTGQSLFANSGQNMFGSAGQNPVFSQQNPDRDPFAQGGAPQTGTTGFSLNLSAGNQMPTMNFGKARK